MNPCSRPGCVAFAKPGQLTCGPHTVPFKKPCVQCLGSGSIAGGKTHLGEWTGRAVACPGCAGQGQTGTLPKPKTTTPPNGRRR